MKQAPVLNVDNEVSELPEQEILVTDTDIEPFDLDSTHLSNAGRDRVGFVGIRRHAKTHNKVRH